MKDEPQTRDANKVHSRDPIHSNLLRDKYNAEIAQKANQARQAALQTNLDVITTELFRLESIRAEHDNLMDELSETRRDLSKVKDSWRVARMNNTLDKARVTNVRIVSPPSIPSEPVMMLGMPHRIAITGMGGAIGFFLALGAYLFIMALREAGLIRGAAKQAAATAEATPADESLELGVWAITDDEDFPGRPPSQA